MFAWDWVICLALKNQESKSDPCEPPLTQPLQHRGGDLGLISLVLRVWPVVYQGYGFANVAIFIVLFSYWM